MQRSTSTLLSDQESSGEFLLSLVISNCFDPESHIEARDRCVVLGEEFRSALRLAASIRAQLLTLCHVSRSMREKAQKLLYRSFHSDESLRPPRKKPLTLLFLRTLLHSSQLAEAVEELYLIMPGARAVNSSSLSTDALMKSIETSYSRKLIDKALYTDLSNNTVYAEYRLLLTLCPNVKTLAVEAYNEPQDFHWLVKLIKEQHTSNQVDKTISSASRRSMSKIDYLSYQHGCAGDYGSLAFIRNCLHLPSLKTLQLGRIYVTANVDLQPVAGSVLSSIKLMDPVWTAEGIAALLINCPPLAELELVASHCDGCYGSPHCDLDFPALGQVLQQHGTKLTHLTVDTRDACEYGDTNKSYGDRRPFLGKLKQLDSLTHLRVPLAQLVGDSVDRLILSTVEDDSEQLSSLIDRLHRNILPRSILSLTLL